jgi:hypothetical protein
MNASGRVRRPERITDLPRDQECLAKLQISRP